LPEPLRPPPTSRYRASSEGAHNEQGEVSSRRSSPRRSATRGAAAAESPRERSPHAEEGLEERLEVAFANLRGGGGAAAAEKRADALLNFHKDGQDGIKKAERVFGNEEAMKFFEGNWLSRLNNPERFAEEWGDRGHKVVAKSSVLLYGPPGNGKTNIARWVASQSGKGTLFLDVSGMKGRSDLITSVFALAYEMQPSILFFDEVDSFAMNIHTSTRSALLQGLGLRTLGSRVLIIMGSNKRESLDQATMRAGRIDGKFLIENPSPKLRLSLIRAWVEEPLARDDISRGTFAECAKLWDALYLARGDSDEENPGSAAFLRSHCDNVLNRCALRRQQRDGGRISNAVFREIAGLPAQQPTGASSAGQVFQAQI